MGRRVPQPKLFYCTSLEERIPQDHLLRKISSVIDFSFIYVRSYYSHTGSPSVEPVVVFKMALLGYLYGLTSERKLAQECRLNLAFMWFLGYDLDETPPDHSILSKARVRLGREVYEQFFRHVVQVLSVSIKKLTTVLVKKLTTWGKKIIRVIQGLTHGVFSKSVSAGSFLRS